MKMQIILSKRNKTLLKRLVKNLFPELKHVKIKKQHVILKKTLFSKPKKVTVAEFVLKTLPNALSNYSNTMDQGNLFPFFSNITEAGNYFINSLDEDIIEYLDTCYSDIILSYKLNEEFTPESLTSSDAETIDIIESKPFKAKRSKYIDRYKKEIDYVIDSLEHELKIVHISTNSAKRGPPIYNLCALRNTG